MGKALDGVRILDFTHVQSGPTCTQLLAWFGADVIKVERAGAGDVTREQLRDIPGVDSLYFTMLNHNKRSVTLDTKSAQGKEVLERLVKHCDVLVENFAPGALDRMGFTWERIQAAQSAHDRRLGQGLRTRVPTRTARCTRTSRNAPAARPRPPDSTTGRRSSPARRSATAAPACIWRSASSPRSTSAIPPAAASSVLAAMQDGVLNLCRVKLRDQQRLTRTGVMKEYPQYPNGKFGERRAARRQCLGRRPAGHHRQVQGLGDGSERVSCTSSRRRRCGRTICKVIGKEDWVTDPDYATPDARLPRLNEVFAAVEAWTVTKTKFEAMDLLNEHDIPCGPILSMEELANEPSLRATGTIVEVDHPKRGKYLTVGQPDQAERQPDRGHPLAAAGRAHRRGSGGDSATPPRNVAALQAEQGHLGIQRIMQWLDKVKTIGKRRGSQDSGASEGRQARVALTAPEARGVCEAYGITIPQEGVATTADEATSSSPRASAFPW